MYEKQKDSQGIDYCRAFRAFPDGLWRDVVLASLSVQVEWDASCQQELNLGSFTFRGLISQGFIPTLFLPPALHALLMIYFWIPWLYNKTMWSERYPQEQSKVRLPLSIFLFILAMLFLPLFNLKSSEKGQQRTCIENNKGALTWTWHYINSAILSWLG